MEKAKKQKKVRFSPMICHFSLDFSRFEPLLNRFIKRTDAAVMLPISNKASETKLNRISSFFIGSSAQFKEKKRPRHPQRARRTIYFFCMESGRNASGFSKEGEWYLGLCWKTLFCGGG